MSTIPVAVIGASGYASVHHRGIAHGEKLGLCRLEAVTMLKPYREELGEPEKAAEFAERGVRIYDDYRAMLEGERGRVRLVTVPTGIALHAPMSIDALNAGYDVYCEKPMAGTVADARAMLEAEARSGRTLCLGYQHLSRPTIQRIKSHAVHGRYGELRRARCRVIWPRPQSYYRRNDWAGRVTVNGSVIRDSPLQNATAHYLQNMLYIAGPGPNEAAAPVEVYAENYRANPIESADTQFVRVVTTEEAHIEMWVTHAGPRNVHPAMVLDFEDARLEWSVEGETVVYQGDREVDRVRDPELPDRLLIIENILRSLAAGERPYSVGANSVQHVETIEAVFDASKICTIPRTHLAARLGDRTVDLPPSVDDWSDDLIVTIADIEGIITNRYKDGKSFAEAGLPWAEPGATVRLSGRAGGASR